jgi:tripartite-type tricarboxylate transporter receptor subunit TctC
MRKIELLQNSKSAHRCNLDLNHRSARKRGNWLERGQIRKEATVTRCNRRQLLRAGMAASLAALGANTALSQAYYPQRPIRVIMPFAAGGVGDAAMRLLAPRMEQKLGQKLVIEAKPGAAGNIGTLEVARAEPDGHTILVGAAGNFVINQFLMKMSFDPLAALTPVAKVAEIPIVFCANPALSVRDLSEFIAYARARPGKLNYGSPGNGSVNHLLVENLKRLAGIEIAHNPIGLAAVAGHLKDGKLIAIAVTTDKRLPMLPEVPTVVEAGFPSLAISNWWAMAAPKQTPESTVGALNQAVIDALSDSTVVEHFAALGMRVPTQTREQFIASLTSESDLWSEVIRRGKIAIE